MNDSTTETSCAVLIVGAGPVGLALAIELGRRQIDTVLVEKRDGSLSVPKMTAVSARNIEFCRRWGIIDDVRGAMWSDAYPLDFIYLTSLQGRELARMAFPSYARRGELDYTPDGGYLCPQTYFDPILAKRAASFPSVDIRYHCCCDALEEAADGVTAHLSGDGSRAAATIAADYVVGCDGPSGMVRTALGIELTGLGVVAQSLNVYFRSAELAGRHDKGWARFYRVIDETGCWSELIPIDGRELWRLTVFDVTKSPGTPADQLRRLMGADFPFEIISASPWERRDVVADRYGRGRLFIAGDAAHQCSPTGGLGMHTGIEDAVNIAWKLEAMVKGWGGPLLLQSYDAERRPIGKRNVDLATLAFQEISGMPGGDALQDASAEGDRQRGRMAAAMEDLRRYSVNEIDKTQYCYEGSPICVADGTPSPPSANQIGYVPSSRPGTRAPHAWIEPGRSTIDLFDDAFVLLQFGGPDADAVPLARAMTERGVPFRVIRLDGTDNAGWAKIADAYARRLVLVRPDGHVAWRGDDLTIEPLHLADVVRGAAAADAA